MRDKRIFVCDSSSLPEKQHLIQELCYKGEPHSAIVLRFSGQVFAYLNRCAHMPKRLDCNRKRIFDETREYLRCSMHGILYQPESGKSISTMCNGEQLQTIRLLESEGKIYFNDKHVSDKKQI